MYLSESRSSHATTSIRIRCPCLPRSVPRHSVSWSSGTVVPLADRLHKFRARWATTDAPPTPTKAEQPPRLAPDQQLLKGRHVVVVGGGMAGMMAAMSVARHGATVQVFEMRPLEFSTGPNTWVIAWTGRGFDALKVAGADTVNIDFSLQHAGHTIVLPDNTSVFIRGFEHEQPDDPDKPKVPKAMGTRAVLTRYVREQALHVHPEIELRCNCKLLDADLGERRLTFEDTTTHERFDVKADLVIGADGGKSKIRRLMTQQVPGFKVDEQSSWVSNVGVALPKLPDDLNSLGKPVTFAPPYSDTESWTEKGWIMTNFLSRRTEYPSGFASIFSHPDEGYSCVLGMPDMWWQSPRDEHGVRALLLDSFPHLPKSCLDLLVKAASVPDPVVRPVPPSIKCSSIGIPGVMLVGDAAHSVSPQYGQGSQTALEDALFITAAIEETQGNIVEMCRVYNASRRDDVHALIDLDRWSVNGSIDAPGSGVMKWLLAAPFKANAFLCKWTTWLPKMLQPLHFNMRLNLGQQPFTQVKANMRRDVLIVLLLIIAAAFAAFYASLWLLAILGVAAA